VNSTGALTNTASYDAWGNPSIVGGLTGVTPFGYAGGYTDPDGLIYLLNRYYNPATGQFMSVDPDLSKTLLPYSYASGNPVSQTDPNGLDSEGAEGNAGYFWGNFFWINDRYVLAWGWRLNRNEVPWYGGYFEWYSDSNGSWGYNGGPIFAFGEGTLWEDDILPTRIHGAYADIGIQAYCDGWKLEWGFVWVPWYSISAILNMAAKRG
jgi:RHS repeat-associated protein